MSTEQSARIHPKFGVGTTEYMRSVGGCALTLECGQNEDPQAPEVGYRAILACLRHLGLLAGPAPEPARGIETLCIHDVVDKLATEDRFVRPWASFDPLRAGELIAVRADGSELRAEEDGCILFPDVNAKPHQEWFYLVRHSDRLAQYRN